MQNVMSDNCCSRNGGGLAASPIRRPTAGRRSPRVVAGVRAMAFSLALPDQQRRPGHHLPGWFEPRQSANCWSARRCPKDRSNPRITLKGVAMVSEGCDRLAGHGSRRAGLRPCAAKFTHSASAKIGNPDVVVAVHRDSPRNEDATALVGITHGNSVGVELSNRGVIQIGNQIAIILEFAAWSARHPERSE